MQVEEAYMQGKNIFEPRERDKRSTYSIGDSNLLPL